MTDLDEYDSSKLISELEDRGYYVYEDYMENEEEMEERIEEEVKDRYEHDHFVLPKDYQCWHLHDFLCNIAECSHTVTDDELSNKLKEKLSNIHHHRATHPA